MTSGSLIAAILCLALALVSVARIKRLPLSRGFRFLLAGLRIVLFFLLAAAFFEPVFVFERLSPSRRTVPVLIDVSQSMRLFSPERTLLPILSTLRKWNSRGVGGKFAFYFFGDSLRPVGTETKPVWLDRRSFFPEAAREKTLGQAVSAIVISDGNWSNAADPSAFFSDKSVWYLPLPAIQRGQYLQMELRNFPAAAPADSPLVAALALEGSSGQGDSLVVSLYEQNRGIATKTIPLTGGFFSRELFFSLSSRIPGRHLYRFAGRFSGMKAGEAAWSCSRYAIHTAFPRHFAYRLYGSSPSLDLRSLELALDRDRDFLPLALDAKEDADLLVYLHWNSDAGNAVSRLKRKGIVVFAGALPDAATVPLPLGCTLVHARRDDFAPSPFDDLDLSKLPPPSCYLDETNGPVRISSAFLAAVVPHGNPAGIDSVPVVYAGIWNGRQSIVCSAAGLWRWDFLPLAIEPAEEKAFAFSNRFAAIIKERLVNSLDEQLFVYPPEPLYEGDSLPLRLLFPAGLPVPAGLHLACSFTSGNFRQDTELTATVIGNPSQSLRLRPLPAGSYRFTAAGVCNDNRFAFTDSLQVGEDRSEYLVQGQNLPILQKFGQPLSDISDSSLAATVFSTLPGSGQIKEFFPIRRDWPLLLLVFLVLAGEWIARRVAGLD